MRHWADPTHGISGQNPMLTEHGFSIYNSKDNMCVLFCFIIHHFFIRYLLLVILLLTPSEGFCQEKEQASPADIKLILLGDSAVGKSK